MKTGLPKVVSDRPYCAGDYNALRNICPYRTGPLCRGRVRPLVLPSGPTGMIYTREGATVKSPGARGSSTS